MKLIFGYYRISKESKNLEEKKENIINKFKKSIFYKDIYVNALDIRRNWENLKLILKKGDTVIITGKGSEKWIHIAQGKKIPWNERKTVEEAL